MLGGCSLTYGDKTIGDANYHLKKPWMLLAYLIVFRNRAIPVDELINLLLPGKCCRIFLKYGRAPKYSSGAMLPNQKSLWEEIVFHIRTIVSS